MNLLLANGRTTMRRTCLVFLIWPLVLLYSFALCSAGMASTTSSSIPTTATTISTPDINAKSGGTQLQVSVPMLMRVPSCQKAYGELELRNTVSFLTRFQEVLLCNQHLEWKRMEGNERSWRLPMPILLSFQTLMCKIKNKSILKHAVDITSHTWSIHVHKIEIHSILRKLFLSTPFRKRWNKLLSSVNLGVRFREEFGTTNPFPSNCISRDCLREVCRWNQGKKQKYHLLSSHNILK